MGRDHAERAIEPAESREPGGMNKFLLEVEQSFFERGLLGQRNNAVKGGVLPELEVKEAGPEKRTEKSAAKPNEHFGLQTEASERTEKAVGKGVEASKLSDADKKVATDIVKGIAEGDTDKLQDVVDRLGKTKEGRARLQNIVKELNEIYNNRGVRDIHLSYPLKDENGTHWELEVAGKTRSGVEKYVYIKPGERPVSGEMYGPHKELDRGDTAKIDSAQEKEAAKVLRKMTEHGQEHLAKKEQDAKEARQREFDREIEQLRREQMGR